MIRRSAFETGMDIMLSIFGGKSKITRIMHDVNISYTPLKVHLELLIGRGFVERHKEVLSDKRVKYRYTVTGLGVELVLAYKELLKVWKKS